MTSVVHCKRERYDVMIDRTSMFGNPYHMGYHSEGGIVTRWTREESIEHYAGYFYYRMEHDKEFFDAVVNLKGKTLGCWCKPKACHGDIIKAYLDGDNNGEY